MYTKRRGRPPRELRAAIKFCVRVSVVPEDGGGAKCNTTSAMPPMRCSERRSSRSPTIGVTPRARKAAALALRRVSA